jgi:hypothetical protein
MYYIPRAPVERRVPGITACIQFVRSHHRGLRFEITAVGHFTNDATDNAFHLLDIPSGKPKASSVFEKRLLPGDRRKRK